MEDTEQKQDNQTLACNLDVAVSAMISRGVAYRYGSFLIALLLIFASLYCRVRLLEIPLERDEGGFAYMGQQLLNGISPYHSGNMKILPGIHLAYAGSMLLFGETPAGIHAGLLTVNALTILLVFLVARRMIAVEGAVVAAGIYAILSVSQSLIGVFAHATHFVNLFVLAGLLALLHGEERNQSRYFFVSGFCLGLSVLMKQHGMFFCLFAFSYVLGVDLVYSKQIKRLLQRIVVMTVGMVIPYLVTCVYMYLNGVFQEFWFWTVILSLDYATTEGTLTDVLSSVWAFFDNMSTNVRLFWLAALIGMFLILCSGTFVKRRWFMLSLLLFSVIATLPSLAFYPHYFVVMLPALALLTGICFEALPRVSARIVGPRTASSVVVLLFLAMTLSTFYNRFDYLFTLSPFDVSRTIYGTNPFPESLEVGRYIRNNSEPDSKIAVFGSEPQIYFYADRLSATDYLYMYPLVEQQPHLISMQEELINEIEQSAPGYIVFVSTSTSLMFDETAGNSLLQWMVNYLQENYLQVGVVEIGGWDDTRYFWDGDALKHIPSTENFMLVYKREDV